MPSSNPFHSGYLGGCDQKKL